MFSQSLFLLVLCLVISPITSNRDIIGSWESIDSSLCDKVTVQFTVNTFQWFVDPILFCLKTKSITGVYYIGNTSIVVRVARPVEIVPSRYFVYALSEDNSVLNLTDLDGDVTMFKRKEDFPIQGVWDGTLRALLDSLSYEGRFYWNGPFFYFWYANTPAYGIFMDWEFDSGVGSFDLQFRDGSVFWTGVSSGTITGSEAPVSFQFSLDRSLTLNAQRDTSDLNGEYVFWSTDWCDSYLILKDGFYLNVITGNPNCLTPMVLQGIYDDNGDGTITINSWNSITGLPSSETMEYTVFTNRSLILGDNEYSPAVQHKRIFVKEIYTYSGSVIDIIFYQIKQLFLTQFGDLLTLRDYDILSYNISYIGKKRASAESEVIIHEQNQDDPIEFIESSTNDVVSLETSTVSEESIRFIQESESFTTSDDEISKSSNPQADTSVVLIVGICAASFVVIAVLVLVYWKFFLQSAR